MNKEVLRATVFDIQGFSLQDGPGIRTTVFFKGCPLNCRWCSNPESISPSMEIGFIASLCNVCKKCELVCTEGAINSNSDDKIHLARPRCTLCGKCLEVCPTEAIVIWGREMTVQELLEKVKQDRIFYESSGGVTMSGGEALQQFPFNFHFLQACREIGIHTCLDTSGYARTEVLEQVLQVTDLVLYDIKHLNPAKHCEYVGKDNELILKNARVVASSGVRMICRLPLIPGVNDSTQNIEEMAKFVKQLEGDVPIEILPFHRLARSKYAALDRPYLMERVESPTGERIEEIKAKFESFGVRARVVR
ncbi:glycyl-radical enzyme activating protein [Chloroflexota bacterium]